MKRFSSIVVTAAVTVTALSVLGPASAAPGCVTSGEFNRISNGMLQGRVHQIFGTSGRSLFRNPGVVHNEAREYVVCGHPWSGGSFVQVQYDNYATHGGPVRVSDRQMQIH